MTRWLITAAILGTALLGAIMYIARPEVVEHQATRALSPIKNAIAGYQSEQAAKEKAAAYQEWMARYQVSTDCVSPPSALKQMECRNREGEWTAAFERHWAQRRAE